MRATILGIQFRINPDSVSHEQACFQREVGVYVDVEFINALDDVFDWSQPAELMKKYQGVILGGSGELYFDGEKDLADPARKMSYELVEKLRPLFVYLFENDIPTLGICYGHQLLGAFAGAQVTCDRTQMKTKSHELKLMVDRHDYFLFSDLPESFHAHYGHKDSLDRVPEGSVLLMHGGDACKVSALQYKNNIFTTQFHPEITFEDVMRKMNNSPEYLPEGVVATEIFKNDPYSKTILQNFGKFVALRTEQNHE